MTQPVKTGPSGDRFESHCKELSTALARMAEMRGIPDSVVWEKSQKRKILKAIDRKKDDKLQNWLYQTKMITPWERRSYKPSIEEASKLVRLKQNEQNVGLLRGSERLSRVAPIEKASSITFAELSRVEKRAVKLLCGAKKKPKKNLVEERAISLANAVRRDWFSPTRDIGRPKGTCSQKIRNVGLQYIVPLSVAEIIAVVKPLIEEVSGTEAPFDVLATAVQVALPAASDESISRIIMRDKRKAGRANTAGHLTS